MQSLLKQRCCSMRRRCLLMSVLVTMLFFVTSTVLLAAWLDIRVEDIIPEDEALKLMVVGLGVGGKNRMHKSVSLYKSVFLPPEENSPHPIIIWWTPFTGEKRRVRECGKGKCLMTHSRTEQNNPQTDAFMFYGSDLKWTDLPLPRDQHVFWGLLHEESPKNNWLFAYEDGISLFNFTATCSRHSSYPLVSQYLESLEKLTKPVRVPTSQKSKDGLALVSYIHSDCHPPSDRDTYVQELMKHVSVDSYGECLHNKDLPEDLRIPGTGEAVVNTSDVFHIVAKYKFSLAFENAICDDYITEKFWRPLEAGSVPIVRGSASIRDWAPDSNHSLIMASDFPNPKKLAEYLLYLDTHDEEYEQLLEWKRSGITNQRLLEHMKTREWFVNDWQKLDYSDGFECYVCDQVYERRERIARGEQPQPIIATQDHYSCLFPKPVFELTAEIRHHYDAKWNLLYWRYIAKCAELEAKAVSSAIISGGTIESVAAAYGNACRALDHKSIAL